MKLNRKQELALINLGMSELLKQLIPETKPRKVSSKKKTRKWSKQQHERFARTMRKVWKKRKVESHG